MSDEMMDKNRFIDRVRRSRAEWERLILQLDEPALLRPGFCQEWSAKDVIAHIAWHDLEMIELIETRTLAGSELWNLSTDQRNSAIYAQNQDRSLVEVKLEAGQAYARLLEVLESLDEQDLHEPSRFAGMPEDWVPGELIASNTYEHYEEHFPQAQAWHAQ